MAGADLDLCYMTATEAIAKFKTREISPVELMDAVIARIEAINPKLNAIRFFLFSLKMCFSYVTFSVIISKLRFV